MWKATSNGGDRGKNYPQRDSNPCCRHEKPVTPDVTSCQGNTYDSNSPTPSNAHGIDPTDADLRRVVEAWPTLPVDVRARIAAIVAASGDE